MAESGSEGLNPLRYLLSEEEHQRIFERRVVPIRLLGADPQEHPVVVFVAGQPGAGKTKSQEAVEEVLRSEGGSAGVSGDLFRSYHPMYKTLMAQDDKLAAFYTSQDARRWNAKAQDFLIKRRCNVVVETTMRDPKSFQAAVEQFHNAGYRVEVMIMAVPEAQSRLGILHRYQTQRQANGTGRLTAVSTHDKAYQGIATTAGEIDNGNIVVDAVAVVRRGNQLVYANERDSDGAWVNQPSAIQSAIDTERVRIWTQSEQDAFTQVTGSLTGQLPTDLRPQLDDVIGLGQQHMPALTAATASVPSTGPTTSIQAATMGLGSASTRSVVVRATMLGTNDPAAGVPAPRPKPTARRSDHTQDR